MASKHLIVEGIAKGYVKDAKDLLAKQEGLILKNIFSVCKLTDTILFIEECDGFYKQEMSKDDAVELLQTMIEYIKS